MYKSSETEEVLRKIRDGDESVLKECYLAYKEEFIHWMHKHYSIAEEQGEELYHEVFLAFYENVLSEKLTELTSNLKTYIFSIGKYKYLDQVRKEQRHLDYAAEYQNEEELLAESQPAYRTEILLKALAQLGEPCAGLLKRFYFNKSSMKEIASIMGYSSIASAKNQKYKCINRLRELVKKDSKDD